MTATTVPRSGPHDLLHGPLLPTLFRLATPTFFVGEDMFWGQDRLQFVEAALEH